MRVLAAKFPDWERATQALETIQGRFDDLVEAEIAPLAPASEESATEALLAGHVDEEHKSQFEEIVRRAGGEIVADVDETWTRPRHKPASNINEGGGFTS